MSEDRGTWRRGRVFMAALFLAACCAMSVFRGDGDSRTSLLVLDPEPVEDLRKALALEVSKKRFNRAQEKLENVHMAMMDDFQELKKWAVQKEEARAQLQKVMAEYDPTMQIDTAATAEYIQPRASLLHLSSPRLARAQRASAPPEPEPAAAAPPPAGAGLVKSATERQQQADKDEELQKFKSELGEMMQLQKSTKVEVSSLAQDMSAMMARQVQLNGAMARAFKNMGVKKGKKSKEPEMLAGKPKDRDELTARYEESEENSIHKILQKEMARLNLDRPVSPGTAMAAVRKAAEARLRAKAQARLQELSSASNGEGVRQEMEDAIMAPKLL